MRIAICTDIYLPQLSGIADTVYLLSRELIRLGHTVRIYGPKAKGPFVDKVSVKRLPVYYISHSTEAIAIVFPFDMCRDIEDFNPDIIHTHTNSFSLVGMVCLYLKYRLKVPLVGTDNTFPADHMHYFKLNYKPVIFFVRKYASWYYNRCDYTITPSKSLLTELEAYGLSVNAEIISNPIDTLLFRPLDSKKNQTKPSVLLFGRIALEKNLIFALEILAEVSKIMPIDIFVVGDGPYKNVFADKAKSVGLEKSVHYKGLLRGESLVESINSADVYLITSTSDTQSMTTLQAMACGLPVIGSNAGGLPEYIKNGITGFVVDPENKEEFIQKVVVLLKDGDMRKKFGTAGRDSAAQFAAGEIAKKTALIYTGLL